MADDRSSTPSSDKSSPTCSMNSVPTHRPSSTRGRHAISLHTLCSASATTSRHQGSSCPVCGAASPNDEAPNSRVKTSAGLWQRSDPDRHQVSSASVGCGAWPTSTSSLSTTRTCAEPTVAAPVRTRPRWMRRYGATSVAHHGSSLGDYAAQGSNSNGRDGPHHTSPARGTHGAHSGTSGRRAALSLRSSACGTSRTQRTPRRRQHRPACPVRHVREVPGVECVAPDERHANPTLVNGSE